MDSKLTTVALILGCVAFAAGFSSMVGRFIHIARYGEDVDVAAAATAGSQTVEDRKPLEKPATVSGKQSVNA